MLIDGLNLAEGSFLINATIASGTEFPPASAGELFFRSDLGLLHVNNGTVWTAVGSSAAMLEDRPGSYYLDLGNATGVLSVAKGGTGVATLALLKTSLGLQDLQPLDADLTAIAGIQTTAGLLRKTAANTWTLDTATYLTANQPITLSGDVAGSGATAISATLASVGTPGTYRSVTTDAKGRVTGGTNPTTIAQYGLVDAQPLDGDLTAIANVYGNTGILRKDGQNSWHLDTTQYIAGNQNITVTGDVTGSGSTAIPLTLASVGTPGTYRSVTTDAKGRVTGGTNPTTLAGYGITDALSKNGGTMTGNLTMTGSIIPSADVTYDLGSPTRMWRDIYVGPGSIYMNGTKILEEVASTIVFTSDENQNVRIETSGTGNLELQAAAGGAIQMKGTLSISSGKRIVDSAGIQVEFADNIEMGGNKITGLSAPVAGTDAANKAYVDNVTTSDATLVRTTGNQSIAGQKTFTGDVVLAGNLTISGTTTTVNSQTVTLADNILELNSDFTAGTPTENSGIQIRRGDLGIVQFLWDEANDRFTMVSGAGAALPLYTGANITAGSFTGPVMGNATSATRLETARTINGASFDGTNNITFASDAVPEGTTNLYHTVARAAAAAPVQSVFGRTGVIALTTGDVTGALGFTPANKAGDTFTGGVTAPTFTGALAGNATTATALATARTINGVPFNGSANISFTTTAVAEGDNLYHTAARAAAAAPVQTVFGRTGSVSLLSADVTGALGFTPASTASPTFTGTVTAPTFSGALTGNASTATKLATARTIAGVAFDGTANIALSTSNIAEGSNLYFTNARAAAAAPVASVFGRTGAVTLASSDVTGALGFTPLDAAGTAAAATKLATARTINGVAFDGTANITVSDATKLPLSGGSMTGNLTMSNGTDLNLRAGSAEDMGDIVFMNSAGAEKHRIFDGTTGLDYRLNGGTSYRLLHSGNVGGYAPTLTGGGASGSWGISITGNAATATTATNAGNATTLGGLPLGSNSGTQAWGFVPQVGANGVMEVGRYIDFHSTSADGVDYSVRLDSAGNNLTLNGNTVVSANGGTYNIAISGNAATATNSTQLGGIAGNRTMQRRHSEVGNTGPTLDSLLGQPSSYGFAYPTNGSYSGPYMSFGGLGGSEGNYIAQFSLDYGGDGFRFRVHNGDAGVWRGWKEVVTSANWNNYAPGKDGLGAYGTWGISVTGNAATATKLATARTINGVAFDGTANITIATSADWASITNKPANIIASSGTTLNTHDWNTFTGAGTYTVTNFSGPNGPSSVYPYGQLVVYVNGDRVTQEYFSHEGHVATRTKYNASDWGVWRNVITTGNIAGTSVNYANTAGSTGRLTGPAYTNGTDGWFRNTGQTGWYNETYAVGMFALEGGAVRTYNNARLISGNGSPSLPAFAFTGDTDSGMYSNGDGTVAFAVNAQWSGQLNGAGNFQVRGGFYADYVSRFRANRGYNVYGGNTADFTQVFSDDLGAAGLSFHRGGAYAANLSLDPDNCFRFGGWSMAASRFTIDPSGNVTAAGDVVAFSDERLKTNWRDLGNDFVARWANVRHGVYDRTDTGERQVGLGAQSVQEILPDAVRNDSDGMLSLNYGAAAAVASVKLAQKVVSLEEKIAMLEAKIEALLNK